MKKKENLEVVKKRVARYRSKPGYDRLEIASISPYLKKDFLSLPGNNYAKKLSQVIEFWKLNSKSTVTSNEKSKPVKSKKLLESLQIKDWIQFEKEFDNFLFDFKRSNQTRPKLRTQGKQIKEALENRPQFKEAFKKVCEKLPDKILKVFKPMYLQGYFYLYEREIIEISMQESTDKILLLLLQSLKYTVKDEPVKEAKKALGIKT